VLFPAAVEQNTPFDIQYTVKNTGGSDDLYGFLTSKGKELTGSRWRKRIGMNRTITKSYRHPGLSETATITLWVGYL
jgi:hypothetical protein